MKQTSEAQAYAAAFLSGAASAIAASARPALRSVNPKAPTPDARLDPQAKAEARRSESALASRKLTNRWREVNASQGNGGPSQPVDEASLN